MLLAVGMLASCSDNDEGSGTSAEQEEAAAEAIMNAMSPESGGAVTKTDEAVEKASTIEEASKGMDEPGISCGVVYADDATLSGTQGGVNYYVTASWNWMLSCTGFGIPETLEMGFASTREYTSTRMSSDDESDGNIKVSGIELLSDAYVVNSNVDNDGTQVFTLGNGYTLSSDISFTIVNLTYDKATMEIVSGTAEVNFSGVFNGASSATYSGTIEFLGNNEALLTMSSGSTYTFSW
ncbi:hypothetical protein NBRC110019_06480 [Neptunitalea chrysea]|uniref:Uncharacterized protein n=2 Tax=Neptunitalea chrysea TaxID=1647581 RepID=A0A9W6B393_9FLAO|nr:hypothetical protein NBRC110019_06480 [Neptunitalea chrysea]